MLQKTNKLKLHKGDRVINSQTILNLEEEDYYGQEAEVLKVNQTDTVVVKYLIDDSIKTQSIFDFELKN